MNSQECALNISTKYRAGCKSQYPRSHVPVSRVCRWQPEIELLHDAIIRVFIGCMVGLVEYYETDLASKPDVSVPKGIEKNVRCGDDDAMSVENPNPEGRVFPLVGLKRTGNHGYGNVKMGLNDRALLITECDCWCEEPADLYSKGS